MLGPRAGGGPSGQAGARAGRAPAAFGWAWAEQEAPRRSPGRRHPPGGRAGVGERGVGRPVSRAGRAVGGAGGSEAAAVPRPGQAAGCARSAQMGSLHGPLALART